MKYPLLIMLCMTLFSCREETINLPDLPPVPEKKIKQIDFSLLGNNISTLFFHDRTGRVVQLRSPSPILDIQYNGDTVLFQYPAVSNAVVQTNREVKFLVNSSNKPVLRLQKKYNLSGPGGPGALHTQTRYTYDTTRYFYDVTGKLIRSVYRSRDSFVIVIPGGVETETNIVTREDEYWYTGTNINSRNGSGKQTKRVINAAGTNTTDIIFTEIREFEYGTNNPNVFNFANALVFNETSTVFSPNNYDIDHLATQLPVKVINHWVSHLANGQPYYSYSQTDQFDYIYDADGYLKTINKVTPFVTSNYRFVHE